MKKTFAIGSAVAGTIMLASTAQAVPVTLEIWDVLAPVPGALGNNPAQPTGSFTIDGPDFLDNSGDSVQAAIASRGADVTVTIDSSALAAGFTNTSTIGVSAGNETIGDFFNVSAVDVIGGNASVLDNFLLGTVARLTGLVDIAAANTPFSVRSDDGYLINIDGTEVAKAGGLQAPTTTGYDTGAVFGNGLDFEMLWFEANIVDAELRVSGQYRFRDLEPVPLPAGVWLLGTALAGLGLARRKRKAA